MAASVTSRSVAVAIERAMPVSTRSSTSRRSGSRADEARMRSVMAPGGTSAPAAGRAGNEGSVHGRQVGDRQPGRPGAARGLLQERLEIRRAVAPVAAAVDAQAGQAALLGPRAHGVGVDAEDAGRAGDRNGAGG